MGKDDLVFEYIGEFIGKEGYSPSYQEIMLGTGITTKGTVHNILNRLANSNRIKMVPGVSRTIQIIKQ